MDDDGDDFTPPAPYLNMDKYKSLYSLEQRQSLRASDMDTFVEIELY